jgi:hypothetical protein
MVTGHPLVAAPIAVLAMWLLYEATQYRNLWPTALIVLGLSYVTAKANSARTAYLHWKREWDGMGAPATPTKTEPATPGRWRPWAGCAMLGLLWLFFAANRDNPVYDASFAYLTLTLIVVGLVAAIRRRASARAGSEGRQVTVTIAIRHPLMAVPSLKRAYRMLPQHCWEIL